MRSAPRSLPIAGAAALALLVCRQAGAEDQIVPAREEPRHVGKLENRTVRAALRIEMHRALVMLRGKGEGATQLRMSHFFVTAARPPQRWEN
jgi:hypothetical protein